MRIKEAEGYGYEEGEGCNRWQEDGTQCDGTIEFKPDRDHFQGGCSCHISAPCSYCERDWHQCDTCDWLAEEERWGDDAAYAPYYEKPEEVYEQTTEIKEAVRTQDVCFGDVFVRLHL